MAKLSTAPSIRKLDSSSDLHAAVALPPSFTAQEYVRLPNSNNTSNKEKTICPTSSPYTSHHVRDKVSHQIRAKHATFVLLLLYTRSYKVSKPASLHMQLVTGVLSQPVHGTATYRRDDTRDCIVQFWPPDDKHVCPKHVEAWNILIIKFSASSWLISR